MMPGKDKTYLHDKVQRKSATNGVSEENQNQGHSTQKAALGTNTRRKP